MKSTANTRYYVGRLSEPGKWGRKEGDLFVGKYRQTTTNSPENSFPDAIQVNSSILFTFKELGVVIGAGILTAATVFAKGVLGL